MSDGNTAPRVRRVQWHNGKLYMSGAWEAGISATNLTKSQRNEYWHMWSWSPTEGYQPVVWFHTSQGGCGPDGQIHDFTFLPDGRLVVAGAFTRVDNPGGTRYHRVNALAVYDPNEPTANKWRPLGSFQYNGTVSEGGAIDAIAYDPQGNDLYIGGTFGGLRGVHSGHLHRYDFDTGSYEPCEPGLDGAKPTVHRLQVDASTNPSTVWVGGKFHYTAGNGQNPAVSDSTARYSTGLAKFQLGQGWTTFPLEQSKEDESILQRAGDYMYFDSVNVMDFLVDGDDIWIVGSFSEGKNNKGPLRGIAKWDAEHQVWIDPTGKGGVGRECWSIGKAENGKLYFAGAFGGRKTKDAFFDGFKNGDPAAMAISFDPATGAWEQLGSGLSGGVFPECRMAIDGNDVYFVGDFEFIGPENEGKKEWASSRIARWNETIDFTQTPAEVAKDNVPIQIPTPTQPLSEGNEHWSRAFPAPGRRKRPDQPAHTGQTGMDVGTGTPDTSGLAWIGDTLYFTGNYQGVPNQRWYVWTYHAEQGWTPIAFEDRGGKGTGPQSPPEGCKVHDGKLYVYGAINGWNGVAIYDPAAKSWSKLEGKTEDGKEVFGHAVAEGGGCVYDMDWDSKTGDLWLVGASGLENPALKFPKAASKVIRIDKDGVYHPMGWSLNPQDPGKPVKVLSCLLLDESQDPTDVYVGGTFCYYGELPTTNARMAYNVVKWSHADQDWRPIGGGFPAREIDAQHYPNGYPGLPAMPLSDFYGFLRQDFPRVMDLAIDTQGNLYAGGTLAIVDGKLPVAERQESFGIAKYDKASDRWVPVTQTGGFSRDVLQMTWLDEGRTRMLVSGAFEYGQDWTPLNGVAIVDLTSGTIEPLGGGLMREVRDQVVAPMVRHTIKGNEFWFAGLFDHAGVNANSMTSAPIQSGYVAMWDPTRSLDPNAGLAIKPIEPIDAPTGNASKQVKVALEATLEGEGTVTWYERRSNGDFAKKGTGLTYTANLRLKAGDPAPVVYVAVSRPDGSEGGKLPVTIPFK